MKVSSVVQLIMVAGVAGCAALVPSDDADHAAAGIMKIADSLASASALNEAQTEYAAVADLHPASSFATEALLRTAILAGHPGNPGRNDSTAITRLEQYASLPLTMAERQRVQFEIAQLRRARSGDEQLRAVRASLDSLSALAGQQAAALQARSAKIRELETQLADANTELKKLRDVDVSISKRATKK